MCVVDATASTRAGEGCSVARGANTREGRGPDRRGNQATYGDSSGLLTAFTIAPCMPSATWWVNSTLDLLEPGCLESGLVLALRERAGDAADVAAALRALLRGQVVFGDDVADPDPAARLEHARDLGQHGRLVDGEVDHAVRDHDVDDSAGSGICSITPFRKCDVADAGIGGVLLREREHLVGHVEPVGEPGRRRRASPRGSRRCRRRSRGRAPSRLRAGRRPRSGCRSRGRRAPPPRAARRAARRRRAPRRTSTRRSRRRHNRSRCHNHSRRWFLR